MKKIIFPILLCFFSCVKLNALTNINLSEGELIPNFDKNITHYNVYVDEKISEINIECIKDETDIDIKYEKKIELESGENIVEITVTDNLNNQKIYTLNVQLGELLEEKDNAYLRELKIEGYDIDFQYDKLNYEITIDEDTDELIIDYVPYNINAYTIQTGGFNLNQSKNIIEIKVVSEDGNNSNTYIITVNKTITTFKEEKKEETNIFGKTTLTKKEKVITFSIICFIAFLITIIIYLIIFKRKKH